MMIKLITRTAAGLAATGIAVLPLMIGTSAHAIDKHEGGGGGDTIVLTAPDRGRQADAAQVAAGALGGAVVTGAAFVAATRMRRHHDSAPRSA